MKSYSAFSSMLSSEFHKYLMEHEKEASQIPKEAMIIFRVEKDEGFNSWHEKTSLKNREKDQPVIYVEVKSWRKQSALEKVSITRAAV